MTDYIYSMFPKKKQLALLRSHLNKIKNILSCLYDELKSTNERINYSHKKLSDYQHDVSKINLDIETIVDPYSRPLGTGQENPSLENFIRTLESKIKYLEGDIATTKGELALDEDNILEIQSRIDENIYDLRYIKKQFIDIADKSEDDLTLTKWLMEIRSIEAQYQEYKDE